ncbi:DUF3732 domain-containing protein, partial [Salmonella enterica]|nr:DUF3732 domain-containing protein [Salmonella enterica]
PFEIYHFIGQLSSEIRIVDVSPKHDYTEEIDTIVNKINELENKISENNIFKEYTLSLLNEKIKKIFSRMPLKGFEDATPIINKGKK